MGYMEVFQCLFEFLLEISDVDLGEKRNNTQKVGVLLFDTKIEATVDHHQFEKKNEELIAKCT